jgi:hypothetical protein
MKKIRKIYYLFQGKQLVPQIKISGKYLARYGLEIGDLVEISLSQGEISIHKITQQERSHNYEP